jgi:RNA polymerase sigma factor (sigma-70 family)
VHNDNFGEEFEGLAWLAIAVFGERVDAGPISEDDPELVEMVRLVKEALPELPEREYRLMSMRCGFGEFVGRRHTLEEVAESEDITRERVRQIVQKTLARMRFDIQLLGANPGIDN